MNRARQLPARRIRNLVLGALTVLLVAVPATEASAQSGASALERYAAGTWRSFVAMTDEDSGLPADTLHFDGTRERPDLDHQHRRLHVEHGRGREARADLATPRR